MKLTRKFFVRAVLVVLAGICLATPGRSQGPVYIVLWFDTEDYILPQSDDAAKRLAVFLTQQGIRATFKLVGEKGRTLERRGRRDVIDALGRHEIGYHSNTHSQHPTVAEYESLLDWESGVEEFTRRERPGWEDLRRIFGRAPTCYGQPGSSWAPQAHAALKKWGVNIYLDEAAHVGLNGKPFWFGGILNIFNTVEGPQLRPSDDWANLSEAKTKFRSFYSQMSSQPQGGIISLYYHPCEFIHREFWDGVNFARGSNPPREQWKLPPMKSPEESERAFNYFENLVTYMKSFPGVAFVTASEAAKLFRDAAQNHVFSTQELAVIGGQVNADVSFQVHENYALSASEVLSLLTKFVAQVVAEDARPILLEGTPYGPSSPFDVAPGFSRATDDAALSQQWPPKGGSTIEVPWSQFSRTVLDVAGFLEKRQQVPSAVWFGSTPVPPESYLVALAQVASNLLAKGGKPESVIVSPARLAAAGQVAEDSPALWIWPIFPPGFHSAQLMRLAKLQAWTLKPASMAALAQRR